MILKNAERGIALKDAPLYEKLTVTEIKNTGNPGITRLASMGIIPGTHLELIQKKPCPIFKIGSGRLAIDKELASVIKVKKSAENK